MTNSGPTRLTEDDISDLLHRMATERGQGWCFVGVDAPTAAAPELPDELKQALVSPEAHPVPIHHPEIDRTAWPTWLALNTQTAHGSLLLRQSVQCAISEVDAALLQRGAGRRISGWFVLGESIAACAGHWGAQMLRRRPSGQRCLLRLHDPAVLWALWHLLKPAQQVDLLRPFQAWWTLDPVGDLVALERPSAPSTGVTPLDAAWTSEFWQSIALIGALNAALRNTASKRPHQRVDDARQCAMHALLRARRAGFDLQTDLEAYAEHALIFHPKFDSHPLVRDALKKAGPGDSYLESVAALTDSDWHLVRSEQVRPVGA